jgi:hypothetical protein
LRLLETQQTVFGTTTATTSSLVGSGSWNKKGKTMSITMEQAYEILPLVQVAVQKQLDLWDAISDVEKAHGEDMDGLDIAVGTLGSETDVPENITASDLVAVLEDVDLDDGMEEEPSDDEKEEEES